jgi:hypothetical protein
VHGTYAGANKHWAMKIPMCDACLAARRDYLARSRDGKKCVRGLGWPVTLAAPARAVRRG